MRHRDATQTHEEKARWEVHKSATCGFEQILEVAFNKTAAPRPLTYHLTNNSSWINKTCGVMLEKYGPTHKWQATHTHRCVSVGRSARTYIYQLCTDTGFWLEDLPWAMGNRNGLSVCVRERDRERERERERVREMCALITWWWWWWWISDIYRLMHVPSLLFFK